MLAQEVLAERDPPAFHATPLLWYLLPVKPDPDPVHGVAAPPRPTRGPGDLVSLVDTDGFVELPTGPTKFPAGHVATFYRW